MKIVTERDYIGWMAYREGHDEPPDSEGIGGDPFGWGKTEREAIEALFDEEEDRAEKATRK